MNTAATFNPVPFIAEELALTSESVSAVVRLLDEGNTVPFIARYRKEATHSLDEVKIRAIEERRAYLSELEERRRAILKSIEEQGRLSDELRSRIEASRTKSDLEDLYLPFKPKRRTRATIARERGLEPLALRILEQPMSGDPAREAESFVDAAKGVEDPAAALAGARDIVAETVAENAEVRAAVRKLTFEQGVLGSKADPQKTAEPTKFEQYYDFEEPLAKIPSHRYLAIRRGENEEVLKVALKMDAAAVLPRIESLMKLSPASPFAKEMRAAIEDCYQRLLAPSIETDLNTEVKHRSDQQAVEVFADNLKNLLLQARLGERCVLGVDPGLRTGCKCAGVDSTGRYLGSVNFSILGDEEVARNVILKLVAHFKPFAIAVGNGTAGRETEQLIRKTLASAGIRDVIVVSVNEAGASVYSASEVAREEFPDLDVTVRGAISIARRLQDPLAELVKIDPKSIGVGQYQHDVHQPLLARKLDDVVESCVNHVGVELNTASPSLLSRVAGIGAALATKLVKHRDDKGAFKSRKALLKVPGLGPRTFEQCAGFLRIRNAENPLDASAVHPERYELVGRIAADLAVELGALVGDEALAGRIDVKKYVGEGVGEPTLRDIVEELKKPGRDPREVFEPPKFRDDVTSIEDLKPGMAMEGVVTNVTAFGAFVDVGVHHDGLVHVSQLADRFVKDPREVVKVGDKLSVRVVEVDVGRGRISLTARKDGQSSRTRGPAEATTSPTSRSTAATRSPRGKTPAGGDGSRREESRSRDAPPRGHNNPLGDLLKDWGKSPPEP